MLDTCCDFSCEGVQEYWCFRLSPVWNAAVCPEFQAPSWKLVVITVKICDCNFGPPVNVWILRYREDFVFACLSCARAESSSVKHDTCTCTPLRLAPKAPNTRKTQNMQRPRSIQPARRRTSPLIRSTHTAHNGTVVSAPDRNMFRHYEH